jgi:hypothetical protein
MGMHSLPRLFVKKRIFIVEESLKTGKVVEWETKRKRTKEDNI